jgi:ribonuclease PH
LKKIESNVLPSLPYFPPTNMRPDDQLRPVEIQLGYLAHHPANVLYQSGNTIVLCTASVEPNVPPWLEGKGKGWVTAEYNMLPGSTTPRKRRERSKVDGRTTEIQRLIGRSLRAVVDLNALGERSIVVDCDVLQADGGTRTASITGGFIALAKAVKNELPDAMIGHGPLRDSIAAISVGVVEGDVKLDLDYELDYAADVDMNVVMTGGGKFVEIQGTGEEATFDDEQLTSMIAMARKGIAELTKLQLDLLG